MTGAEEMREAARLALEAADRARASAWSAEPMPGVTPPRVTEAMVKVAFSAYSTAIDDVDDCQAFKGSLGEYAMARALEAALAPAATPGGTLCGDCPPVDYPTDATRCTPCPRRTAPAATPGQEPVAWEWLDTFGAREKVSTTDLPERYRERYGWTSRPLYAAPPTDARRSALEEAARVAETMHRDPLWDRSHAACESYGACVAERIRALAEPTR